MNKLWFDHTLTESVDAPRVHIQLVPHQDVDIENKTEFRLRKEIVRGLEARGHGIQYTNSKSVVQGIFIDAAESIYAKSDPRKQGLPAGY